MESVEKLGLSASGEQVVWTFGESAPQTRAMKFASAIFLTAAIAQTKFKLLSKAFDHKAVKITAEIILLLTTACSQIGIPPPSVSPEAGPSQTPTVSVNVSKLDTGSRETLEAAGGGDQTATAAAATIQPVMTETPEPILTRVPDTAIPNVVPTEVPTVAPTETATTEPEPQTCLDIPSIEHTAMATLVRRGYLPSSFNTVTAEALATAGSQEQTAYQEALNKWLNDWISSDSRLQAYVKRNGRTPLNWMADDNGPYLMVEANALLAGHFSVTAPDGALMTCAIAVIGENDANGVLTAHAIPMVAALTSPDGTFAGISIDLGTYPGPAWDQQYIIDALTQKEQSEDPSIYFLGDMTAPREKSEWTHSAPQFKRWVMLPYFTPAFQALPDMNTVKHIFGSLMVGPYEYTEWSLRELQKGTFSQAYGIFLEGFQDLTAEGTKVWLTP